MTDLVLIHAFPVSSAMYDDLTALLPSAVRVLAPDLPGFGSSPLPDAEPSVDVYADAVAEAMDEAGVGSAVIGGTSMGGYTAMAMLRRHPERVAGLVLMDTKAGADDAAGVARRESLAERVLAEGPAVLVTDVLPGLTGSYTQGNRPEVVARVQAWVEACDPAAAAWAQRAMAARPDSVADLQAFDGHALVVMGEEDVMSSAADAMAMRVALRNDSFAIIPQAGHLTPVEDAPAVAEALTRFLAGDAPLG